MGNTVIAGMAVSASARGVSGITVAMPARPPITSPTRVEARSGGAIAWMSPSVTIPARRSSATTGTARQDLIERLRKDRAATVEDVTKRFAWKATDPAHRPENLPPDHPDNVVFEDGAIFAAFSRGQREGARQGVTGYVDDWIAQNLPWRFSVAEIRCQAHIWWGEQDPIVSRVETEYLARTIPRSILTIYPGEGHGILFTHWADMVAAMR